MTNDANTDPILQQTSNGNPLIKDAKKPERYPSPAPVGSIRFDCIGFILNSLLSVYNILPSLSFVMTTMSILSFISLKFLFKILHNKFNSYLFKNNIFVFSNIFVKYSLL